jgi:adenylate cyclase
LSLDPRAVDALIGLAYCYVRGAQSGFSEQRQDDVGKATALINQGLAFDPDRARGHWVRGMVLTNLAQPEQAAAEFENAIALDRNFAPAYGSLGDVVTFLGKPEETIRFNEQAMRLSPRDPQLANWQFDIGQACMMLGRDADALNWLRRARAANPHFPWVPLALAATYALTGDLDAARGALAEFYKFGTPITSVTAFRAAAPMFDLPHMRRFSSRIYDGLRKAGMPE